MAVCHCEFSLLPLGPCLFLAAAGTASDAGATCAASAAPGRTTAGGGSGMPAFLNGQATPCAAVLAGAAAGACASAGAGVSTGAGAGAAALAGAAHESTASTGGLALAGAFALAGGLALTGGLALGGATTRAATRPAFEGATGRAAGTAGKTTPAFEAEERGLLFEVIASLGSGTVAGCLGPSLGSGTIAEFRETLAAVAVLRVERQGGTGSSGGVLGAASSGHLGAGASGGLGAGAAAASGV